MSSADVEGAVALQPLAFPPPFSDDLYWDPEHLSRHIDLFPEGQLVAIEENQVIGACSNTLISEERWGAGENWYRTVGGPELRNFDPNGSTLYGIDITVHPSFRRIGVGRAFYEHRFQMVRNRRLARYGTGCRMPDYKLHREETPDLTIEDYAEQVLAGKIVDRTMTPLLRYGLRFVKVIRDYMPDVESGNAGALLEWPRP